MSKHLTTTHKVENISATKQVNVLILISWHHLPHPHHPHVFKRAHRLGKVGYNTPQQETPGWLLSILWTGWYQHTVQEQGEDMRGLSGKEGLFWTGNRKIGIGCTARETPIGILRGRKPEVMGREGLQACAVCQFCLTVHLINNTKARPIIKNRYSPEFPPCYFSSVSCTTVSWHSQSLSPSGGMFVSVVSSDSHLLSLPLPFLRPLQGLPRPAGGLIGGTDSCSVPNRPD